MHEAMARYQSLYLLKPIGSHRRMADDLFREVTAKCDDCGGSGLWDVDDGASWKPCAVCQGFGVLFTQAKTKIDEIRRNILEVFPDAAAEPVPLLGGMPLAYDLSQGTIVGLPTRDADGGISDEEEYEDVWKNVTAADLAAGIHGALVENQGERLPSGRTFLTVGDISVRSALLSAVPDSAKAAAIRALDDEMVDLEEALSRFTPTPPEPIVYCSVSTSMVSGSWGIFEFRLCGRGYLYYRPDFGVGDDESLPILAAWEPDDNLAQRRACILQVYEREWHERVLPPAMGEWAVGDPDLLQEAILRVLRANPRAWKAVFERLKVAPEPREAAHDTLMQVCKLSGAPANRVREILHFVSAPHDHLRHAVWRRHPNEEMQRVVVALLVHCIAKDPLRTNARLHWKN